MNNRVIGNLSDSAHDFKNIVWPEIQSLVGGGRLEAVEGVSNVDFALDLDLLAGIDGWQILGNRGMRGIGSRVQWAGVHDSFTIRYSVESGVETEYAKRLRAIRSRASEGLIYPHLTIQAYLDGRGGNLLSAAIVETEELFEYVAWLVETDAISDENNRKKFGIRFNSQDKSEFIFVTWQHLVNTNFESLQIFFPEDNW